MMKSEERRERERGKESESEIPFCPRHYRKKTQHNIEGPKLSILSKHNMSLYVASDVPQHLIGSKRVFSAMKYFSFENAVHFGV